jgi:hypothetical protein
MNKVTNPFKISFLVLCLILICVNSFQLFKKLSPQHPISFSGLKFSGLGDILGKETTIGYISDLDLKEAGPLAEYEQAQYMLAPIVLDIINPAHKFVVINPSSDAAALDKLKEFNARPLLRNQFGVILATTDQTSSNKDSKTENLRP